MQRENFFFRSAAETFAADTRLAARQNVKKNKMKLGMI